VLSVYKGNYERRPDIVLYVNGIAAPLAHANWDY
jgi:type I site-specific restriction-modification system R (restriction) subunit